MYRALFVLMTLFQCNLAVSKSAVFTDGLELYWTKLSPAVIQIQCGSSFWGWQLMTGLPYVTCSLLQHMTYFIMCLYKHCVCPLLSNFITPLSHAAKLYSQCGLSHLCSGRVIHQHFVAQNSFTCHWVHHWACEVFKVN